MVFTVRPAVLVGPFPSGSAPAYFRYLVAAFRETSGPPCCPCLACFSTLPAFSAPMQFIISPQPPAASDTPRSVSGSPQDASWPQLPWPSLSSGLVLFHRRFGPQTWTFLIALQVSHYTIWCRSR